MESNITHVLAKICTNVIRAQGLTQEQALQVGAKIIGNLSSSESTKHSPSEAQTDKVLNNSESAPSSKAREDDSPKKVDKPKRVIASAGELCTCTMCHKAPFKRTMDITDPMNRADFVRAFTPQREVSPMRVKDDGVFIGDNEVTVRNVDGNVAIDCPLCKGDKSVWIIGTPMSLGSNESDTNVGSIGGDAVGSL
jgi:hypothetical protein